jgi:hypothetical protein
MLDITEFITRSREERRQHLNLEEPCLERGGNSTNHKGVLAQYLNTTIPSGRILLCHACNNGKCSNPRHLYWGTDYENIVLDGREHGTYKNIWLKQIEKYGYEKACQMNSRIGNTYGSGNKGKPKTELHKKHLSESIKKKHKINKKENKVYKAGRNPAVPFELTMKIYNELGFTEGAKYFGISYDAFKSRYYLAKNKLTDQQNNNIISECLTVKDNV